METKRIYIDRYQFKLDEDPSIDTLITLLIDAQTNGATHVKIYERSQLYMDAYLDQVKPETEAKIINIQ